MNLRHHEMNKIIGPIVRKNNEMKTFLNEYKQLLVKENDTIKFLMSEKKISY